jgi:hypothetical protein
MTTHLTGILTHTQIPVHTCDTVEMGIVLPRFSKLKPISVLMHTMSTLSQVYPYPCHALIIPLQLIHFQVHINQETIPASLAGSV